MLRGTISRLICLSAIATVPRVASLAVVMAIGSSAELANGNDSLTLNDILAKEARGEAVDRSALPQETPAERWAAGRVEIGDQWKDIDKLDSPVVDLSAYEQQRDMSADTVEAQLALARWCEKHGLRDQAAAHYYAVLAIEPNNRIARHELQHKWQNDRWFTKREIEAAKNSTRQLGKNLDAWTPKIKGILQKLSNGDAEQKIAALEQLDAINDEAAIPAMELAIGFVEPQVALPLVKKIATFKSEDSCRALLQLATADPPTQLSDLAVEKLKEYPEMLVVPDLLSALSTPLEISTQFTGLPNGRLAQATLVSRELKDRKLIERTETQYRASSRANRAIYTARPDASGIRGVRRSIEYVSPEILNAARDAAEDQAEQTKVQADAENARIQQQVARVCSVLRTVTNQNLEDDARQWWAWWGNRHDRYQDSKSKAVFQRNNYINRDYSVESDRELLTPQTPTVRTHECLVAGTLIQTQAGMRAIEKIKVGDMVVSQDTETGELSLKPVIRTSRTEPKPLVAITTEHETLTATPAHYWWVSGQGWKRSCELEKGMQMHTATGTIEVKEVRQAAAQVTFNLVIDDYHTYFVGQDRILSYDVMPLKGTLRVVPGYLVTTK